VFVVTSAEQQREDDQALAAEYALGLLDPSDARAFEGRLARDPVLRALYVIWAEDLVKLTDDIAPVTPPPLVYATLDRRLFGDQRQGWLQWLGLVPALVGGLIAAALVYFVSSFGLLTTPVGPRLNAEIAATDQSLVVLAAYDPTTQHLLLNRTAGAAAPGRVLELWLIAGDNPPVSLGVLPDTASTTVILTPEAAAALAGGTVPVRLAISDEPTGGSTTGSPTGAVVAIGPVIES
jgi:anti-sigma-K factor RskA